MPSYIKDRNLQKNLLPFLMESIHQGISVIDHDMNVVFINREACRLLDLPLSVLKEDPSLENLFRFNAMRGDYGNCDIEETVAERMKLARKFIAHDIERERPCGRVIRIQGTPIGDSGFITLYTDVTEQRAYEGRLEAIQYELELKLQNSIDELRHNRDLMVNAIDSIEDGLIIFDENQHLIMANTAMQDLYPSMKRHLPLRSHISKIEGFDLPDKIEEEFEARQNGFCTTERKLHNGKWYRIDHSNTINGGMIAVFSDISVYKEQTGKLQEHTNQLVKLLQKEITLSETQREFVSMASHEFKTPLAIIDSNAQRIERKIGDISEDKLRARVDNIRESVERMQYLINRFMDFSSDEIAGLRMEARNQDFRRILEKLCLSHREMDEGNNIEWHLEALPRSAKFDQNLLDQCVSNILSNAIKYSEPGAPIHVIGRTDKRYMMIEVHDQGVGIPRAEQSKIFNKYYRASTSSGIAGTGIGLNFAQMALKEHGGHIKVESSVGKGSCFTIFLPIALAIEELEETNDSNSSRDEQENEDRIAS